MMTPLLRKSKKLLSAQGQFLFVFIFFIYSLINTSFCQTSVPYTTGTGSFTVPAGVTSVTVEVWGGGGGGGRASSSNGAAAGGGGGGAYAKKTFTGLTTGNLIYYSVGTGGAGGTSSVASGSGTASWANTVSSAPTTNSGALANGGGAGTSVSSNTSGNGGAGGTTGFGDVTKAGGAGAAGVTSGTVGGGGGGAAGNVNAAGASATGITGAVGVNPAGSGGSGATNTAGGNGTNYGGGGAGGHRNGSSNNGGNGAGGYVLISYCFSSMTLTGISAGTICAGNSSTITVTGSASVLSAGTYTVSYNLSAPNSGTAYSATMTVTTAGTGTFTTGNLANSGNTTITLVSILKSGSTCSAATVSAALNTATINVTAPPSVAIAYTSSSFCKTVSSTQPVTVTPTSATGGTYTVSPSGLSIDPVTGAINPSLSNVGNNYTVTYTVTSGSCTSRATALVSIVSPGSYTLSYPTNPVCSSLSGTLTPSNSLTGGGTYSVRRISGSGALSINASTGVITPGSSSPGTYMVKFTSSVTGVCVESDSVQVTINSGPVVTCPSNSTVCSSSAPILLTQSNLPAGVSSVFSGTGVSCTGSGASTLCYFNPSSGTQNITAVYTDLNTCSTTCNYTISVSGSSFFATATPAASFVYSGDSVKILLSSTVAGTQFTWTASTNNPSITGFSSQSTATSSTSITQQVFNTSATTGQITYTITPTLNGCSGVPTTIVISLPSSTFCESPGTFQRGSCIIDMGVVPQTYNNGLKPYGLVYQLLNVSKVPVYWAIKPDKSFGTNPLNKADSTDFILDGINYKGGAFIVPSTYLSQVQTVIDSWASQGVVVRYASRNFNPPVYELLTRIPNAVLDVRSGATIQNGFYERAGIPVSAYTLGGVPTNIANCDDIYVLPHAEPELWTQPYKDSLLNFINNRGWLYSSCRAVSAIESNVGMNFLSSTGLILDSQHGDGTPPYAYSLQSGLEAVKVASDPFMQSIGKLDDAIDWGAETIFLPKTTWRSTTKIAIYDSNFVNSGITYPNSAAILAYGRAFGNSSKGMIVYMAGHDFNHGVEAANVAAARIYGNFLLRSGITARPIINPISIPTSANSGQTISLSVSVPPSTSTIVSYEWTSDLNGIFSAQAPVTTFTPPAVDVQTLCTIQFKVTDACGRVGLFCTTIIINPTITNNYIGISQRVCAGVAPAQLDGTLSVAPNGGTLTYQWLMSTTSASTGFVPATGTNNTQNYTPAPLTQTTWFRRQVSANGITVSSTTIQITIIPGPAITTQPSTAGQTICTGNTFNALSIVTSTTPVGYQWYTNTAANNTGGSLIAGATGAAYTPPSLPNIPYYYYCVLTNTNGCTTTSFVTGAYNVVGGFSITNPSTLPQTACQGGAITPLTCVGSLASGLTYDWYYNTTASTSGAILVPGGPYTSTFTPNMVGSFYYYCKVTAPDFACSPAVPRIKNSTFSGLITINAAPTAGITNNSAGTEINCTRNSISLTATGGVSYAWNNGLGNTASVTITTPGNDTVTVTGANGCTAKSGVVITRNVALPAAGITNNYATTQLTCETRSISVTATGGVSYLWSNGLGTNSNVYLNAAGTYTVTVRGANGCTKDTSIVITSGIVGSTWTGAGINLYWDNPDNWCGPVPTDTSDVIIPNTGGNDPVISNTEAEARNITILPGANIYMDGETLQIFGSLNASGNLDAVFGTIELKGTTPQTISGSNFALNRIMNLRISNAAGVTLAGTNDTLKLTGTLDFGKSNCTLNANGNLTIVSDAGNTGRVGDMTSEGQYSGNKIIGNVTVERYIPNHTKAWQMLAVPTVGQTIKDAWQEGNAPMANVKPGYGTIITSNNGGNSAGANGLGFDIFTSPGPSMKYFNATDSTWIGVASTNNTAIANSKGYMILVRGDRSVTTSSMAPTATKMRTTGLLYQPIGNAPATINVMANKYESVGNPYASAIDLTKLTRTGGVQDVYYVWDPKLTTAGTSAYGLGGYQQFIRNGSTYIVSPGGGSYANGNVNIESGQAFFVRAFGTSGTVSFAENQKTIGGAIVTRENNDISYLHTKLSVVYNNTPILLDGALVQFDENFSNEINEQDAFKLAGASSENISVVNKGIKLAGDKRSIAISGDTVYYNLGNLRSQNYQLQLQPNELSAVAQSAKLIDTYLGTSTPISLDSTTVVTFTAVINTPSAASNRFYMVFENLGALPVNIKSISASRNDDKTNTVFWSVDNEINIEKYSIEKSENGVSFVEIGNTAAKVNNGGSAGYSFVDQHPYNSRNFYRVKAVSANGMLQYSKIVAVSSDTKNNAISLYPNPVVNSVANVYFNDLAAGAYSVMIYNTSGQLLQKSNIVTTFRTEKVSLKLNGSVIPGEYEMRIVSQAGTNYRQQFIVK